MVKMKWLGFINLYFLLCAVGMVVFLIAKKDVLSKNAIESPEMTYSKFEYPELDQVIGEVREGYDVEKLLVSTEESVAKGKEIFASKCAACHGAEGKGDGTPLTPPPRNFHSLEGWTNGPQKSQMFKTLTEGVPGTGMASYGTLPVEDRMALINFIHTIVDGYPTPNAKDVAFLEGNYKLNESKKTKSQVSVATAMSVVAQESKNVSAEDLENSGISAWASNPEATFLILAGSNAWKKDVATWFAFLAQYENVSSLNGLKAINSDQQLQIYNQLKTFFAGKVSPVEIPVALEVVSEPEVTTTEMVAVEGE